MVVGRVSSSDYKVNLNQAEITCNPELYKDYFTPGELGQIQQMQLFSRDSPLPPVAYLKTSGGLFHDCSIHDIDIMTWILGEFPTEVMVNGNAMFPEVKIVKTGQNAFNLWHSDPSPRRL